MRTQPLKHNSGQILLIALILFAAIIVIVLTVSFVSRTDTQVTKLQEENQRALAAAEAGVQLALKKGQSVPIGTSGTDLSTLSPFSGNANFIDPVASNKFMSPSVQKDDQYTFYLGNFDVTNSSFDPSVATDLKVCFGTTSAAPALEIALLKGDGQIYKYAVDSQGRLGSGADSAISASSHTDCQNGSTQLSYSYTINQTDIGDNAQFLVVRTLFSQTILILKSATGNLPQQGRLVESVATSNQTGVSKKIQVFQTYPQIPPEFLSSQF